MTTGDTESVQVVCFFVGDGQYALDIMRIKEIIRPVPITRVPLAPAFVEGIIELRGAFLPIVDVRKRFGIEAAPPNREARYVVVALEGRIIGLLVDRVADRRRVALSEVSDPPAMAFGADTRFFSGVVKSEGEIVVLLDLDAILSASEKQLLRGMEAANT
jgi:purine-binding chemotaxis protein CheW